MTYTCRRPPPVTFTLHHTPAHPPAASRPNAAKRPTPCSSSIAAHTVLPGGKRKPSTVHTSSHRRAPPAYLARPRRPTPCPRSPGTPPRNVHTSSHPPARAPSACPANSPTSRQVEKPASRQTPPPPLTTSTNHHPAFAGLPRGKTPRPARSAATPLQHQQGRTPTPSPPAYPSGKPPNRTPTQEPLLPVRTRPGHILAPPGPCRAPRPRRHLARVVSGTRPPCVRQLIWAGPHPGATRAAGSPRAGPSLPRTSPCTLCSYSCFGA